MKTRELPETVVERRAIIYVRQSTTTQVLENLESQRRQYDLADLARSYGFNDVVVIDEDLGRSASGLVARPGFDALVAQLCQGIIGAVFCLEASRLARNGREWHHLLELCGMVGARVVDTDGAYDPSMPNDRLLLGLKGTMSEFELTLIRRRLVEGALAKAKRGEFRLCVPVGYLWTREHGLERDPDRRVQDAVSIVFTLFERFQSARQVHLHMCREGLLFPRAADGKLSVDRRWVRPVYRNVIGILQNPFYAGAYAYGKSTHKTTIVDGRLTKSYGHNVPIEKWPVLIHDHHDAYVSWEAFQRNQEWLRRNAHRRPAGRAKAGRGGRALLSGLVRCRRCGRMLAVTYGGRHRIARYSCRRGELHGLTPCLTFGASRPDDVIVDELLRVVEPLAIEAALTAADLADVRTADRARALELERQQADYEVLLARRRYDAVDPDNRLVASELEMRWNSAIVRLREVEARIASVVSTPPPKADRDALLTLSQDLKAAWDAPTTDARAKQQLVRALVEEIVVDVDDKTREIVLVVHWRGGRHSELRVRKPATGEHRKRAPANADAMIREMAGTWSDEHVAAVLNRMGLKTGQGLSWTKRRVESFRKAAGIAAYAPRGDEQWLTMRDAAKKLDVTSHVIRSLIKAGTLPAKQVMLDAPWQIRVVDLELPAVREAIRERRTLPRPCRVARDDRNLTIPGT